MQRNRFRVYLVLLPLLSLALLAGCDRRTPDERLATAVQFYQQGDAASAEMEALKVVEKVPADPIGLQASLLLAQIYTQQNRLEEAQIQLKNVLEHVSQLDPMGVSALRMYLGTLTAQKKYDEALATAEQYQKEYADDAGTSLSLRVVQADIQTAAGQTTAAREMIQSVMNETTGPAELALYRDLYVKTYYRDEDSTGALNYLQDQLAQLSTNEDKVPVLTTLAQISAANEDYQASRQYLQQLTQIMTEGIREEPDPMARAGRAIRLAQVYMSVDNLPGADRVFETLYAMDFQQPEAVQNIVNSLVETKIRLGQTSAAQTLLRDAAQKNPQGPFGQVLQQMDQLAAEGRLHTVAPEDTSTLVMKYRGDQLLWPAELPQLLGTADASTTGAAEAGSVQTQPNAETTGTATTAAPTTATLATSDNTEQTTAMPESTPIVEPEAAPADPEQGLAPASSEADAATTATESM